MDSVIMLKNSIIDSINSFEGEELVKELLNIAIQYSFHDTHFDTLKKCVLKCMGDKDWMQDLSREERLDLAKTLFVEINDFKISDQIAAQKMKTTQYIAKQRRKA